MITKRMSNINLLYKILLLFLYFLKIYYAWFSLPKQEWRSTIGDHCPMQKIEEQERRSFTFVTSYKPNRFYHTNKMLGDIAIKYKDAR